MEKTILDFINGIDGDSCHENSICVRANKLLDAWRDGSVCEIDADNFGNPESGYVWESELYALALEAGAK